MGGRGDDHSRRTPFMTLETASVFVERKYDAKKVKITDVRHAELER